MARETDPRREIVDAIRYVVDTGCKWRALPGRWPMPDAGSRAFQLWE